METFSLNVFDKTQGSVFVDRKQLSGGNCPLLSISNKPEDRSVNHCPGARFSCAAIDSLGSKIAAGDRYGNVYVFLLDQNKFWLFGKLKCCCLAICLTPLPERDVLVATSDCQLHLFQSGSNSYVNKLIGHVTCINHIETDEKGFVALSSALTETIVWDLTDLTIRHFLPNPFQVDLIKSVFANPDGTVVSFFKNDSILCWDYEAKVYNKQYTNVKSKLGLTTADVSSDGNFLVGGGKSEWLLLWKCDMDDVPFVLSVSSAIKTTVRQVAFVQARLACGQDRNLAVISHEGTLHLYSAATGQQLETIKIESERILCANMAKRKRRIVVLTCAGHLKLYDLDAMEEDKHKKNLHLIEKMTAAAAPPVIKNKQKKELSRMTMEKLKGLVKEQGHLPEKYRHLIWSNLLGLPDNSCAFNALQIAAVRLTDVATLDKLNYPCGNATQHRALFRLCSLLHEWCPRLEDVEFLPWLAFPFAKIFHHDMHKCTEIVATFIANWAQNWFAYYPNPPFNILAATEEILSHHDPQLLLHFIRHGVMAQVYVWLLLRSIFSEFLPQSDWLIVMDHMLSAPPTFLPYLVVALNINSRQRLMRLTTIESFERFYKTEHCDVRIDHVIKRAYSIGCSTPSHIQRIVRETMGTETMLLGNDDRYAKFDNFPSLLVSFKDENKMMQIEIDYIKKRQNIVLGEQQTAIEQVTFPRFRFEHDQFVPRETFPKGNNTTKLTGEPMSTYAIELNEIRQSKFEGNIGSFDVAKSVLQTRHQLIQKKIK